MAARSSGISHEYLDEKVELYKVTLVLIATNFAAWVSSIEFIASKCSSKIGKTEVSVGRGHLLSGICWVTRLRDVEKSHGTKVGSPGSLCVLVSKSLCMILTAGLRAVRGALSDTP